MSDNNSNFNLKNHKRLGILLVTSGPSGTGKTTICKELLSNNKNLYFSVSCTTRPQRKGEINGKDYYFVTKEEFKKRVDNKEFIEHALVHDNYYGTLKSEALNKLQNGIDVLLDIDVQGAMQIKNETKNDHLLKKCSEFVFIAPPDFSILEQRLRSRGTDNEIVIQKRLIDAKEELKCYVDYDYLVINDNLEQAVSHLQAILTALQNKTARLE